jgi:hypothetical protein
MSERTQQAIDAERARVAQEIVDGQAAGRPEMTVEDWKRFARNWIETAARHAANETHYREHRDRAVGVLEQVAKLAALEAPVQRGQRGDTVKILPVMSRGVVYVHEDGETFEMAPLQVFRGDGGQTVVRIGRNCLFFDESGRFDGTESHPAGIAPDSEVAQRIRAAFDAQGQNRGLPPDEPYFQPGTRGHAAETRAWPAAQRERDGGGVYTMVHGKPPPSDATH